METTTQYKHFSAKVRIQLRAEGNVYDVAAAGPRDIILRQPADIPPCDAEIVMFVDGKGHMLPVRLRNGAVPFETKIRITHRGEMQKLVSATDDHHGDQRG